MLIIVSLPDLIDLTYISDRMGGSGLLLPDYFSQRDAIIEFRGGNLFWGKGLINQTPTSAFRDLDDAVNMIGHDNIILIFHSGEFP